MKHGFHLRTAVLACCAGATMIGFGQVRVVGQAAIVRTDTGGPSVDLALVRKYCVSCHSSRLQTGGVVLDGLEPSNIVADAAVWERVVRMLNAGMMPPPGVARPDAAEAEQFIGAVTTAIDTVAAARPNPGPPIPLHRINRTEYQNAVRDLLAVDVDVRALLPPDDAAYGFDNIAGVLKISESLMTRYLASARQVSRVALGTDPPGIAAKTYEVSAFGRQYEQSDRLPFGTRGGTLVRHAFPEDGEYVIRVWFWCNQTASGCEPTTGFDDTHQVEITIDGQQVKLMTMPASKAVGGFTGVGNVAIHPEQWDVRIPVKAGLRDVGVTFLRLPSYVPTDYARVRFQRPSYEGNMVAAGMGVYQPYLKSVTITGPFQPTVKRTLDTPSRRRILTCQPSNAVPEAQCARRILRTLANRAYRRPVRESDLAPLMKFFSQGREEGSFDQGVEMALRALLVSPSFLFRAESAPESVERSASSRGITDVELASRLSFFIWSSIPDDQLLTLAAGGTLHQPTVLERQVKRMLADPRSRSLTTSFVEQWLNLRRLDIATPTESMFPDFDESLRAAYHQEIEMFVRSVILEDRSVIDLLDANYTYVNERLASHYGIPNVLGPELRRVELSPDSPRRGLLGKGAVLLATSHDNRTSPVVRGKWILENILGQGPAPPPPNVPAFKESEGPSRALTMRERMAAHRTNPVCAGCHAKMDPAGFALENFDAIGRWRDHDETMKAIDAAGTLPDGTAFKSFQELRAALLTKPNRFVGVLTEKLLTYGLGRGLEYYDMPTVRSIVDRAARNQYRFSSVITGIVESVPFQRRSETTAVRVGENASR